MRFLDRVAYLYDEPRLLLSQELREPRNYFAIMSSLAAGNTRLNEIVQDSGLDRGVVSRYLETLADLELIEREVPVTELDPSRSRRGLYRLRDPFFRFLFRFVLPNLSEMLLYDTRNNLFDSQVAPEMNHFVAPMFERLCIEWVRRRAAQGELSLRTPRVGRYWDAQNEIDVLAFDKENALWGECKWSMRPIGPAILRDLKLRAQRAGGRLGDRKTRYILFSRSGFRDVEPSPDVILVDLASLVEDRMPD